MNILGLPDALRTMVSKKFAEARLNGDLVLSETQLATLSTPSDLRIQLRYCPALAKKPTQNVISLEKSNGPKKKFDPFDDPSTALLIAAIPSQQSTHNLVLNKYPVILNHFIVATKRNKPQTDLLEEDDLFLTYACLRAWQEESENVRRKHSLFAFFNSGDESGASQAHRHLQFLPIEDMAGAENDGWQPLCRTMTSTIERNKPLLHNPDLPFIHFATALGPDLTAQALHEKYRTLLNVASTSVAKDAGFNGPAQSPSTKPEISYNLAITTEIMAIIPRKTESSVVPGIADSSVAINGTILAGTMMVKSEAEWNRLRSEPELVQHILSNILFPITSSSSYAGKQQHL